MRTAQRSACRLTIFVEEDDQWNHRPLYHEIVRMAKDAGLAGASTFRGIEGFGAHHDIHTARILSLSLNLPVAIVIVDEEPRIRDFLPQLETVISQGLATIEAVEAISYPAGPTASERRR